LVLRVATTQFTLYMAIAGGFGLTTGGALAGPLDHAFDYSQIFLVIATAQMVMALGLGLVNLPNYYARLAALGEHRQAASVKTS
jgi:hypothetical protein